MRHETLLVALLVAAALVAPTAHAKKKKAPDPVPTPPIALPAPSSGSQAGGLPATNERVAALEAAVAGLRVDLADEIAARRAADTALANHVATIPQVFVGEGAVSNVKGATVTVASKTVPAGTYLVLAAVHMVNSQATGDANARCVMLANDDLLADTADLEFPILTTEGDSKALGSSMFAPLQGSYVSAIPITIRVNCTESNGDNGGLDAFAQIAAMKAGGVQ